MVKEKMPGLPVDWPTLGLQLAAFLVIFGGALAGFLGMATRRISWLRTIGLWGNHLMPLIVGRGERFVLTSFVLTGGGIVALIGKFIFDDYPYSGDEWSYVLQAKIFSEGRLHADPPVPTGLCRVGDGQ